MRFCISKKAPGDCHGAGYRNTLRAASTVTNVSTPCEANQVGKSKKTSEQALEAKLTMNRAEQENWPTKVSYQLIKQCPLGLTSTLSRWQCQKSPSCQPSWWLSCAYAGNASARNKSGRTKAAEVSSSLP